MKLLWLFKGVCAFFVVAYLMGFVGSILNISFWYHLVMETGLRVVLSKEWANIGTAVCVLLLISLALVIAAFSFNKSHIIFLTGVGFQVVSFCLVVSILVMTNPGNRDSIKASVIENFEIFSKAQKYEQKGTCHGLNGRDVCTMNSEMVKAGMPLCCDEEIDRLLNLLISQYKYIMPYSISWIGSLIILGILIFLYPKLHIE